MLKLNFHKTKNQKKSKKKIFKMLKPQNEKNVNLFFLKTQNLEVEKIFHTFYSTFENPKVRKNSRKKHFQNPFPLSLNTLFERCKMEKLGFLRVSDAFLFILRN